MKLKRQENNLNSMTVGKNHSGSFTSMEPISAVEFLIRSPIQM